MMNRRFIQIVTAIVVIGMIMSVLAAVISALS